MPLTLGPSDYTVYDGLQQIVYTQVLPGGNQNATVQHAIGLGWARQERRVDGGFIYQIVQEWFLPVAEMNGLMPQEGDFLTDAAGKVWWLQADIEQTAANLGGSGDMYSFTALLNR